MDITQQKKIKRMEKKIKKYEEIVKDLINDDSHSDSHSDSDNNTDNNESANNYTILNIKNDRLDKSNNYILLEQNKNGESSKFINTNLGETFTVIENNVKDLNELNRNEYNAIKQQEDLHKYEKTCEYYKKMGTVWGWTTFIAGIGKYAIIPL